MIQAARSAQHELDLPMLAYAFASRSEAAVEHLVGFALARFQQDLQSGLRPELERTLFASGDAAARALRRSRGRFAIGALGIPFVGGSPEYRREYARMRRQGLLPGPAAAPGGGGAAAARAPGAPPQITMDPAAWARAHPAPAPEPAAVPVPVAQQAVVGSPRWEGGPVSVDLNGEHVIFGIRSMNGVSFPSEEKFLQQAKEELGAHGETIVRDAAAITRDILPGSRVDLRLTADALSISASIPGARIERDYRRAADGSITVDHKYFAVPKERQGSGLAAKMMAHSVEAYERAGDDRITVHANIDVGGYAWARMGFETSNPSRFIDRVKARATWMNHTAARRESLLDGMRKAGQGVPHWLASQPEGKHLLLGSDWSGHINLKSASGRAAVSRIKEKAKGKKKS